MQDKLFQNSNRLLTAISLILLYFTNTVNNFNLSSFLIYLCFIATFNIIHLFKNNCLFQLDYPHWIAFLINIAYFYLIACLNIIAKFNCNRYLFLI